jgi:hypothetical protein
MISHESNFVMPTIPQFIQTLFNDHQTRLAAVSAAPGVVGLSLDLDQMSATYLSKAVQILVRPKYAADNNPGTSPEDKISSLASSVSRLSKQVRPLAYLRANRSAADGLMSAQAIISISRKSFAFLT